MRVSKLAKDLGCAEVDLLGLIHRLGYPRYTASDQQLPAEVVERVRRHSAELAKKAPPPPRVVPGPVRRLDGVADAETRHLLDVEMRGVQVLGGAKASAKVARATPVRLTPGGAPPVAAPPAAPAPARAVGPPPVAPGSTAPAAPVAPPVDTRVAELERVLGRVEWERRELAERVQRVEAERDALAERLAAATPGRTLRALLVARGLANDEEIDFFFTGVGSGHRSTELVDHLASASPAVERWITERVILIGPDEEAPPGMVGVRVPASRGEGSSSPPVRAALNRLSTALMVNGKRRLAVIGGPPAAVRVLRDGLDRRVELRVAVAAVPGALLVDWGDGNTPGALVVRGRDVVAFCNEVVAQLEG